MYAGQDVLLTYCWEMNGTIIVPGTQLRMKRDRKVYTFRALAYCPEDKITYVDCVLADGSFCYKRIEQVESVWYSKKSMRKPRR